MLFVRTIAIAIAIELVDPRNEFICTRVLQRAQEFTTVLQPIPRAVI